VPIFMRRMLRGEPVTVFGDGSMVRDYLYIDDLISMMMAALFNPAPGHVYNVASGEALSVLDLISRLEVATGVTAHVEHAPDRPTDVHRVTLDVSRFTRDYGVTATTQLADGLLPTVDWVREFEQ
ncbi:MAG: NAD-dependent epimerase/dehydratase family protein, partial [Thermoleophilia bacterium]|nr:NAD-dependent epimerase/dehydratase family protein [Thermoleophilia bacterium]